MTDSGSFRDSAGYIFKRNGEIFRCIKPLYREHYDHLMSSGLYQKLVSEGFLVPHTEVQNDSLLKDDFYKIIKPEQIPFISYPYEWCFSQLKDAALLLLETQKVALEFDMTLKDGSAFNIQFHKGKPVFIDTLSFEKYEENTPWIAYRQFCQHFLCPLVLMKYVDYRISQISKSHIDGIPLDLTSKILPKRSYLLNFGILVHIVMHAKYSKKYEDNQQRIASEKYVSKKSVSNLVHFLRSTLDGLRLNRLKTTWDDYYTEGISHENYLKQKEVVINDWAKEIKPNFTWDIGSNDGKYSRILSQHSQLVISLESDFNCVEDNYNQAKTEKSDNLLSLWMDITNPSPGIGWSTVERDSLIARMGKPDLVLLLALTHHLVISSNISFVMIAEWLSAHCNNLIIEFVPKTDDKVKLLLLNRRDIFDDYTESNFEAFFETYFTIKKKVNIANSGRLLYFMKVK